MPQAAEESERRILILGDSLTAGYGVEKSEAFPAQLENKIKKQYPNTVVVNAGSSGSTSASGLSRLRWHMKKKPFLLILALGANDGLRGTPLEATRKNLSETIDLAKNNGIKVYIAGMKLPKNYGESYRQGFEKIFSDLVKDKNIKSIPFLLKGVAANPKLNLSDGIHPNQKGHKIIAETVYAQIKDEL